MMNDKTFQDAADKLAKTQTQSTQHMAEQERADGILQMLRDLNRLARENGCIAAAWALEFACEQANLLHSLTDRAGEFLGTDPDLRVPECIAVALDHAEKIRREARR